MTIPDRVQLTTPMTIGIHVVMGAGFTLVFVAALYLLNVSLRPLGFSAFLLVIAPTVIGAYLDKKAMLKDKAEQLIEHGFQKCKTQDIDPALITTLGRMQPYKFRTKSIHRAFHSVENNQEIYTIQLRAGDGKHDIAFTACAVWTPIELPTAIIRRRTFKDRVAFFSDSHRHKLGEHHIIHSKNEQFVQTICMMHPWFMLRRAKSKNFRIHQPPGLKEQWAINGHWIIYTDLGNADTKSMLKLADFLATFVKEFESNLGETKTI